MNSTFNLVDRTQDVFNYAMLDKIYFDITDEEEFENVQFSEFRLENLIHVTQERDESHENTPNDISSINRFSFTRKLNLRKHISEVHDNINHMCGTCQKSFAKKCLLKIHIDTAHNNISYACDGCGKKFSTKRSLKTHIDAVYNDEPYLCVICVETFVNRRSLKVHLDTTHSGDVRACDICGEMYTRNDLHVHDLRVHVGRVRQVRSTTHSCDTCRKSFSQKGNLISHIKSVHNRFGHECHICGKKFLTKRYIKTHINLVHLPLRISYSCDMCEYKCSNKSSLQKHIDSMHYDSKRTRAISEKTFGK
ncbi:hypothetical protein TKK_0008443 [Trichogramma kaykai]